jgi:hypothetical protein
VIKTDLEGLKDGILYITGLGIVFFKDYKRFRELWNKPEKTKEKY